tara:strand:+ start:740 stop:2092 length:1353 start_codon:yes stop_codon:yes gene_type:complete
MSIRLRRSSLRKTSIGIDSIRKSITSLSEGLVSIGKNASELLKETRKSNQFKSKLISQDAEFFKKRRENVLRKQREDELEASTVTGVTKRQGSLVQKSTKGFLGRILDFIGMLIIGWALLNLPKIIAAFKKLFGLINRVVGVFTGFIDGMRDFFESIGTGLDNFFSVFNKFNFFEDDKKIKDTFEETQSNIVKLNKDFAESINSFVMDKDIQSAGDVAKNLGLSDDSDKEKDKGTNDLSDQEFLLENSSVPEDEEDKRKDISIDNLDEGQEIERRNLGGPVEAGQPVIVGDAAGIDSRSAELFVPNEDGRVVSNNELEDITTGGDDGNNEIDDLLSGLEESGGQKTNTSAPPMSSAGGTVLEDEKKSDSPEIKGIKKSRSDTAIMPISIREEFDFKAPKKKRKVIIIGNNKQSMSPQISMSGGGSKSIRVLTKSTEKTLVELQSIALSSG